MKLKHEITIMTLETKTEHSFYLIRQLALLFDNNAANGRFNATSAVMVMFTCVFLDSRCIILCVWCYFAFVFIKCSSCLNMNILRSVRIIVITLGVHLFHQYRFENTKVVIKMRISKKNRQYNDQKKKYKRTNSDLQNIHIKLQIE
jgi:hypothetical protein